MSLTSTLYKLKKSLALFNDEKTQIGTLAKQIYDINLVAD